ncbi:MAG: hypothetical protein ACN6OP_26645 [Pseudomonadales bacterium]
MSSLNKRVYEEIMAEAGLQPEASLSLPKEPCDEGAHAETGGQDCKEEGQNSQHPATSSSAPADAEQDISRLDLLDRKLDACVEQVIDALKNHAGAPKFVGLAPDEKAHNPPMTDVTRAELDAKFELLDTKLGARIQQAVDAMQARDEVHKHALEKMQAEFVARDALIAEREKQQALVAQNVLNAMSNRDEVYAEIAKRHEQTVQQLRDDARGRDELAAEKANTEKVAAQKTLTKMMGRNAAMGLRVKHVDEGLSKFETELTKIDAKIESNAKSVKTNIWGGVLATASIVALALAGFDSGRETSKAIAESTVKLEQLIKAQEAKAAAPTAPAAPSAATPVPAATPESPAAK